jgi:hypothetical protein
LGGPPCPALALDSPTTLALYPPKNIDLDKTASTGRMDTILDTKRKQNKLQEAHVYY